MAQKKILPVIAILSATLLGACAERVQTHGHVIEESQVEKIRLGAHSRREVAQLLGTPSTLSTFDAKRWYYISERVSLGALSRAKLQEREILIIDFDESGKAAAISYKNKTDGQNIAISDKRTKTHGQQLGIIQQATENVKRGLKGLK